MSTQQLPSLLDPKIIRRACLDAVIKLNPRELLTNPVILVTEMCAALCTWVTIRDPSSFYVQITAWLWFTVLFANFAEAIAEGRGKAHADALRKMRTKTIARKLAGNGEERVPAESLKVGDTVVCEAGDIVPGDGEVIEGIAS